MEQKEKEINITIEICKLIASVFVVFIHVRVSGVKGEIMNCLARFAVPLFFAISGYFSYQVDAKHLLRRIRRMFDLNVIATGMYLFWGCYVIKYIHAHSRAQYLIEKLSIENLAQWLFLNVNPFSGHLWYLVAILLCYVYLWIYIVFYGKDKVKYYSLYIVGFVLFFFSIAFGVNAIGTELKVRYELYRNATFFGFPMFAMGIFIHEYKDQILKNYNINIIKGVCLIFLGTLLSLLQWFGIGKVEMPIGSMIVVITLMLLVISDPLGIVFNERIKKSIVDLGNISLTIYIIHPLIQDVFMQLSNRFSLLSFIVESGFAYPISVIVLSAICGIIFDIVWRRGLKKWR